MAREERMVVESFCAEFSLIWAVVETSWLGISQVKIPIHVAKSRTITLIKSSKIGN